MKHCTAWLSILMTGFTMAQEVPVAPPVSKPQMPAGSKVEVNGIAATVNGHVITKNKVGFMLAPIYGQLAAQFPRRGSEFERQLTDAKDKILQELIDREIILSEFAELQKKGANLPDYLVDQEIKRQIRETHNGNEAHFDDELKKARMTRDGYRKMVKDQLIVQAMRSEHFSEAPPPLSSEVSQEYAEQKDSLRDVTKDVVSFHKVYIPRLDQENPLSTPEDQLSLAEKIAQQAKSGTDMVELAKKYSKDAYAAEGGIQKDIPRTDLAPEFATIMSKAKVGEILGPLEDPAGFTIARLDAIQKGPSPAFSEVKQAMEERVRRKKTSAAYEKWIASRRKVATIRRFM